MRDVEAEARRLASIGLPLDEVVARLVQYAEGDLDAGEARRLVARIQAEPPPGAYERYLDEVGE